MEVDVEHTITDQGETTEATSYQCQKGEGRTLFLDFASSVCAIDGAPARLTGAEYKMLKLLTENTGSVVTRDMFLNRLYKDRLEEPEVRIIDVFICHLRKKLGSFASNLKSVWGRGYKWLEGGEAVTKKSYQTINGLPPTDSKRWNSRRKEEVVLAVKNGLLSFEEACSRYSLTTTELERWQTQLKLHGRKGLRETKMQDYVRQAY